MGAYKMQIIWLVLLVAFAIVEGATVSLVSVWFCVGAAAALVASFFSSSPALQTAVFLVVSCLVLLLMRPYARKRLQTQRVPTNAELIVGKTGRVLTLISPEIPGRVRVEGVDWNARAEEVLLKDALVAVAALEGTTLLVRSVHKEEPKP